MQLRVSYISIHRPYSNTVSRFPHTSRRPLIFTKSAGHIRCLLHYHVFNDPHTFQRSPREPQFPQKFLKNMQSPQATHRSNVSGFDVIFGSPYGLAASPCAGIGSHIPWHFPYGIAVPPYNHTPDEFPHTFWQIPTGRPFSHSHGRSPIDRPSPHTIHKLQKSGFHFDETSGSCPTNPQPTTSSRHPEPALQSSKPSAGQFQQITHTCDWGAPSPPACTYLHVLPWSCAHLHGHGHALTFKGTCTAMVIRSFTCTGMHGHVNVRAHF